MCDTLKKIAKIVGIIVAIAGACAAIYVLIKKFCPCCKKDPLCEEGCDYVSCAEFDDSEDNVEAVEVKAPQAEESAE